MSGLMLLSPLTTGEEGMREGEKKEEREGGREGGREEVNLSQSAKGQE